MKVVNTQPFELIYTLAEHQHLGLIIEPHVVQVNSKGQLTLTHQRIFTKTSDYFREQMDETDFKILKLLDELEQNYIAKKFYVDKHNKPIKPSQFFEKYCDPELFANFIRPFIEKRLSGALELLRTKKLFKTGNDNNPCSVELKIAEEKCSALFHFRRDEEGTRYFPTLKYKDERLEFMFKNARLICNQPAWLLVDDTVYDFQKNIDGKKLVPFFNKRFIHVPKSAEENYYRKFVIPLVEKYDVYAQGFDIVTEKREAVPVLKIVRLWEDTVQLQLCFEYGNHLFLYHNSHKVSVTLEKDGDKYTFKRIRRSVQWEDSKKDFLESLGLELSEGSVFRLKNKEIKLRDDKTLSAFETVNKYEFIDWIILHKEHIEVSGFKIIQEEERQKYFLGTREIKIDVKEFNDWFDVNAVVRFGEFEFSFLSLKEHILRGKREFLLPNGEMAVIPDEWFSTFNSIFDNAEPGENIRLKNYHLGLITELSNCNGVSLKLSEKLSNLRDHQTIEDFNLPVMFKGELRPYQRAGYNWLSFLRENKLGGCLADDMGLGKTIQTLALLQYEKEHSGTNLTVINSENENIAGDGKQPAQISLFDSMASQHATSAGNASEELKITKEPEEAEVRKHTTSLIVVPTSLIYNWFNEAAKFAPELKILIHTGVGRTKDSAQFRYFDVILTTYGTVRSDQDMMRNHYFHYIILDESQNIKNPHSQAAKAVKSLKSAHKIVLTGTPVENSVTELWSQMSFINPGLLGDYQSFMENYTIPIEKQADEKKLKILKTLINPFVLRRTKTQVAKDLPSKIEQIIHCDMTEEQESEYETIKSQYRNELLQVIKEQGLGKSKLTIIQGLTKLRQLANHPKLIDPEYSHGSGKFEEVTERIETAMAEGHKLLVFSQFVKQLELYKTWLEGKNIPFAYLHGQMPQKERAEQVDRFNQREDIKVFIISLKAGGLGLNLVSADYVFLLDPWWNPAVEKQAEDRSYRIGQTRNVFTYKFITRNTVEEKILKLQQRKLQLAENLIETEESFVKSLDIDELLDLLA